jgi:MFS family permease
MAPGFDRRIRDSSFPSPPAGSAILVSRTPDLPAAGSRRRPYQALRHRDYVLLGSATLISLVGTQMQNVALDWHVYLLTHSPLALGFVGLTRVVPIIAFSLWGGVVADRHDRKVVMFAAQAVMTLAALALAALTFFHRETLASLYLLTSVTSAATAFDNPSRQALIPRLVSKEDLPGALSLNLTIFHVGMIAGPAISGLVIAESTRRLGQPSHGLSLVYLANALSFIAVLGALMMMKTSGRPVRATGELPTTSHSLAEGLRFVFTTPIIVSTMALDFFATLFAGAMSLLPIIADQVLHAGAAGYGLLRTAPALGALVGSFYTAVQPLPRRQGRVLLWSVGAYGVATIVFGLSRRFWLTYAGLFATGLADLVSTVIRQTVRQVLTPDELRGRMTSVNMIFFMGGPQLGELEAGFVASLFASAATGVVVSIVSGGIATIAAVAIVAAFAPVVRSYEPG